jgi:hypothetical protein
MLVYKLVRVARVLPALRSFLRSHIIDVHLDRAQVIVPLIVRLWLSIFVHTNHDRLPIDAPPFSVAMDCNSIGAA